MATRIKKQTAATKEIASPQTSTSKNDSTGETTTPKTTGKGPGVSRRLAKKTPAKKNVKKTATVAFKAKGRKPKKNLKINPKNLARALIENGKGLEAKKLLLKNGIKEIKPRKNAKVVKKIEEEPPPVLEPIFPQEDNVEFKKTPRKRAKRAPKVPALIDVKKIKKELLEEPLDQAVVEVPVTETPSTKPVAKKTRQRKQKSDTSTIEEVMNDLSFLIKGDELKKEVDDSMSESSKSDQIKPKRITKKQRLDLLKKDLIKKDNIENTLSKLDPADKKVIDRLDLNVRKFKKEMPIVKRRHSIEKFPIGSVEVNTDPLLPQLSVFNQLPRCISPRASKRGSRMRQSIDGPKRSSPYSTRSDSPARILRNGKHRKLKDLTLLEGLEDVKRRKRLCSDLSGSETASKLSGYDSDSSFSDLASLHGSEKDSELSKTLNKDGDSLLTDDSSNLDHKTDIQPDFVKTITSLDARKSNLDTNSNLYSDLKAVDINLNDKEVNKQTIDENIPLELSPSTKVPEKGLILDIMKQAFNNTSEINKSKAAIPPKCDVSKFYGKPDKLESNEEVKQDTLINMKTSNTETEEKTTILEDLLPETDEQMPQLQSIEQSGSREVIHTLESLEDFTSEDKEIEEQESFENIVQGCIDSIGTISPDLPLLPQPTVPDIVEEPSVLPPAEEFENDEVPTIENMSEVLAEIVPNESLEDLGPPQLERTVIEESVIPEYVDNEGGDNVVTITEEDIVDRSPNNEDNVMESVEEIRKEEEILKEVEEGPSETECEVEKMEVEKETTEIECDKVSENNEVECKEILDTKDVAEESPEELAQKESIFKALGLQSLRAAKEAKHQKFRDQSKPSTSKGENYTGTLKTVIKINRDKKKGKSSFKMTLQKSKGKSDGEQTGGEDGYRIMKEGGSSSWKHGKDSSDTAGAHRKSHYSNRSNMDGSSEHTSDGEAPAISPDKNVPEKALVIPEKASSFSIHPGRLCKDECSYCFGKFGLFDTPCHIAQMKSVDRQNKILATEKHLTRDSCLCDACYRHVDRKSNSPSYINKSLKRNSLVAPGPRQNHCHVLGCNNVSTNILRRKWIIKMRKSICQINIDLDNPGLHSIPICDEHFTALEHLMVCAMCKRRLARNHIHYLGPEVKELNEAMRDEGIPITLSDKPVVCKLCKCFASVLLKDPEERQENSVNFFKEYKKRLLHFNDIIPMDAAAAEEPIVVPSKNEKSERRDLDRDLGKRKRRVRNSSNETVNSVNNQFDCQSELNTEEMGNRVQNRVPSTDTNNSQSASQSRSQSPDDEYSRVDYNTLIPAIALECPSDSESKTDYPARKVTVGIQKKIPRLESVKDALEISKSLRARADRNRSNDLAAQKLGQNPSISLRQTYPNIENESDPWVKRSSNLVSNPAISVRQLFPGEEDLPLTGHIDFKNVIEQTPEGWEKCVATIQYDEETKHLWQELQKPYGNKSSFLRHLILLEKYFRNGDLVLSPTASHHAINYRESVHNRLRAYDNIPSSAGNIQPISMIPFNKMHKSSSGIVTSFGQSSNGIPPVTISQVGGEGQSNTSKSAPITLQQLQSPPLLPSSMALQNLASRPKSSGAPPGLISIHPGITRPVAPMMRTQPQSQKIKFPITKNWRPNLIPIDPSKKHERKSGLVQVISGGKPYHITLEDYKKMCAIKRSFEAKQKKIQEQQLVHKQYQQSLLLTPNSLLKPITTKKGLVISKTSGNGSDKPNLQPLPGPSTSTGNLLGDNSETILEKLDRQVERLGQEPKNPTDKNSSALLPRIPKSLTVIPQTVSRKSSRPPSPILYITQKGGSSNGNKS